MSVCVSNVCACVACVCVCVCVLRVCLNHRGESHLSVMAYDQCHQFKCSSPAQRQLWATALDERISKQPPNGHVWLLAFADPKQERASTSRELQRCALLVDFTANVFQLNLLPSSARTQTAPTQIVAAMLFKHVTSVRRNKVTNCLVMGSSHASLPLRVYLDGEIDQRWLVEVAQRIIRQNIRSGGDRWEPATEYAPNTLKKALRSVCRGYVKLQTIQNSDGNVPGPALDHANSGNVLDSWTNVLRVQFQRGAVWIELTPLGDLVVFTGPVSADIHTGAPSPNQVIRTVGCAIASGAEKKIQINCSRFKAQHILSFETGEDQEMWARAIEKCTGRVALPRRMAKGMARWGSPDSPSPITNDSSSVTDV